jgi:hypothetical protein
VSRDGPNPNAITNQPNLAFVRPTLRTVTTTIGAKGARKAEMSRRPTLRRLSKLLYSVHELPRDCFSMDMSVIRTDLPNTPNEVISVWLSTHFKRFGWPPRVDNDWRYVLGLGRDLQFLQSLRWTKQSVKPTPRMLAEPALATIIGLFQTYVLKQTTVYSAIGDGLERFDSCCAYLRERGVFPQPVVLLSSPDGHTVLDGNHRMTAFFYLYGYFRIDHEGIPCLKVTAEQEAWIATK